MAEIRFNYTKQLLIDFPHLKSFDPTPEDNSMSIAEVKKMDPETQGIFLSHIISNKANTNLDVKAIKNILSLDNTHFTRMCSNIWLNSASSAKALQCSSREKKLQIDYTIYAASLPSYYSSILTNAFAAVEQAGASSGKTSPFAENAWANPPTDGKIMIIIETEKKLLELLTPIAGLDQAKHVLASTNAGTLSTALKDSAAIIVYVAYDKLDIKNENNEIDSVKFFVQLVGILGHEIYGNVWRNLTGQDGSRRDYEIAAFDEGIRVLKTTAIDIARKSGTANSENKLLFQRMVKACTDMIKEEAIMRASWVNGDGDSKARVAQPPK